MKITLTGATGFIGGHMLRRLEAAGHELTILSRTPRPGTAAWDASRTEAPAEALDGVDAVIHLAGEPVAQRWSAAARQRIRDSRIDGTRRLVAGLARVRRRPPVLVSASAIGFYGSRGDTVLTETSAPGEGFLAEVTAGWEAEALAARSLGMRVVTVRIGIVLGAGGGALAKMLPIFRAGIGGPLSSGGQWMSWIHVDDLVELFAFALNEPKLDGAVNGTAPEPVTNREFTRELAGQLHRPAVLPVPAMALRLLYGEMASLTLDSQKVQPAAAQAAGFRFRYPQLAPALAAVLDAAAGQRRK